MKIKGFKALCPYLHGTIMSETMEAMVRMLARLPEQQQREMIKTRLAAFADMRDEERLGAMKAMITALQKIDVEDQKKLTYARLEALAESFDDVTRKKLIGTHMMALMGMPKEQMAADLNIMASVMSLCHEACRMKDMNTMRELMMGLQPDKRMMMMQVLPPEVQKMMMG
jgi:hypothetical protein